MTNDPCWKGVRAQKKEGRHGRPGRGARVAHAGAPGCEQVRGAEPPDPAGGLACAARAWLGLRAHPLAGLRRPLRAPELAHALVRAGPHVRPARGPPPRHGRHVAVDARRHHQRPGRA
eukprot:7946148-Alexandrium_andersonii.AAC.1